MPFGRLINFVSNYFSDSIDLFNYDLRRYDLLKMSQFHEFFMRPKPIICGNNGNKRLAISSNVFGGGNLFGGGGGGIGETSKMMTTTNDCRNRNIPSEKEEEDEDEKKNGDGAAPSDRVEDFYPCFVDRNCGVQRVMMEDWIAVLVTQNKLRIRQTPLTTNVATQYRVVEFLFGICDKLAQPPNVKFTALALYDTFMQRHVNELMAEFRAQNRNNTNARRDWSTVEDKFSGQTTLRMFSCVQIASKMETQSRCVKLDDFNTIMRDVGHSYTKDTILKSELRVLRTLSYRINVLTPLTYLETIMKVMQTQFPALNMDLIYPTCLRILETVALLRDDVYKLLLDALVGPRGRYTRLMFRRLQNDFMFLACSTIVTAVLIDVGIECARWIAATLAHLTGVTYLDMTTFCGAVVHAFMELSDDCSMDDEDSYDYEFVEQSRFSRR